MSVYLIKGKGWRYDFVLKGIRYTEAGFKTKRKANQAEALRREGLTNPKIESENMTVLIDMDFLELINKRLDYVKAYNSERHYTDHIYMARKWVKQWGKFKCSEISTALIQSYLLRRSRQASKYTANKELRSLRALFNFAIHPARGLMKKNPTHGIQFFPVEKKIKYVPPKEDVLRVIMAANPDIQDYLWTMALTMGRMSEINSLKWQDVDFKGRYVVLYTRKKKGGHLTPRKVPMPNKLFELLSRRYEKRDKRKPWVFWHRYWSSKKKEWIDGPYKNRSHIMKTLCKKAGVKYFRYHALRHFGASLLDQANVPIGSIQRILGHENRTTTEIYLHSIGDAERDAMDVLNAHFEKEFSEKVPHQSHTNKKKGLAIVP